MNLFQQGQVVLHSGQISFWKIECDALTNADIDTLALMLAEQLPKFNKVFGVPRGGDKLARALAQYESKEPNLPPLIVDDVLTTGKSMIEYKNKLGLDNAIGAVIFARQPELVPNWVYPLFSLTPQKKWQ